MAIKFNQFEIEVADNLNQWLQDVGNGAHHTNLQGKKQITAIQLPSRQLDSSLLKGDGIPCENGASNLHERQRTICRITTRFRRREIMYNATHQHTWLMDEDNRPGIPTATWYYFYRFHEWFYTVPLQRFLGKHRAYGTDCNLIAWIESFLNNRRQCFIVNGQ